LLRLVLALIGAGPSTGERIEAQLVIARHLLEDAKLLKIDVSGFEKRLSRLEKLRPEDAGGAVASLMSDLSNAIEESERAEKREAASIAVNVESKLTKLHGLLEEARTLGVGISRFEAGLSKLEKSLDEPRPEMAEHVTRLTKGLPIRSLLSLFRFRISSSAFYRRSLLFCVTCKAPPAPSGVPLFSEVSVGRLP